MKPDRWQQVERLFVAASQRPSAEWQRFLSEQCGSNQALRLEVESLLTARSQAGNFLDTPALQVAAPVLIHDDPRATCGQMIGPYSLVSQLGKGGMGEVWRAFDSRVGREVAIKFCDSQFTSRFEREARAIAALNHPNVCQLYDIGMRIWSWSWWKASRHAAHSR